MSAYADADASPVQSDRFTPGTANRQQSRLAFQSSPYSVKESSEFGLASHYSMSQFGNSAGQSSASTPDVRSILHLQQSVDPASAAKGDFMLLGSPYQATDSEISFDVEPTQDLSAWRENHHASLPEQYATNSDDRWQIETGTADSPIGYVSGAVANRLQSKVQPASPSYDPRCVFPCTLVIP